MRTLLLAIHQPPLYHLHSSLTFFKVFYSPSLAPGQVAASAFVCMCVCDALDCPGSESEVCTDLPFFCLLVSDCNILAIGF